MPTTNELTQLIEAQAPLVAVDTIEEERVARLLGELATRLQRPLYRWSITAGLLGPGTAGGLARPADLLGHLGGDTPTGIYLLLDLHPFLSDPILARRLREAAQTAAARSLVLVGHDLKLPPDIAKLAAWAELPLPQRADYLNLLKDEVTALRRQQPEREPLAEPEAVDVLLGHLAGLTERDARLVIRRILSDDGSLTRQDMQEVFAAKHKLLGNDSGLALERANVRLDDLAGLANFKSWLATRTGAFRGDPGYAGLDAPKGVLLLGVQGCGKSMAVKAVAAAWDIPLLRLDFGALYNKFLGETERNLRDALRVADAMSPCVLWLDEIEKGLATSHADGGESRRLLGTLLTWMAERKSRVFLVATSNDIEQLPPELVRKGRFDEIFFVDLPTEAIRREILRIHIVKRHQDPAAFDLDDLARRTDNFSGAELEQAVVGALYAANAQKVSLTGEHIAAEAARTRPLAVVMAEKIAYLRAWAAERTVPAD
jgi:AAA+ superfamily predicted ATPase